VMRAVVIAHSFGFLSHRSRTAGPKKMAFKACTD
jgi:hypothetical protein